MLLGKLQTGQEDKFEVKEGLETRWTDGDDDDQTIDQRRGISRLSDLSLLRITLNYDVK